MVASSQQPSSRLARVLLTALVLLIAAPAPPAAARRPRKGKRKPKAPAAAVVAIPAGTLTVAPEGDGAPLKIAVAAFHLDRTEVTVAAYRRCLRSAACSEPQRGTYFSLAERREDFQAFCNWDRPGHDEHPINCVDRAQAAAYCAWAGKRLPTEAEWVYAARGPTPRRYPWGESRDGVALCADRKDKRLGTCPVAEHPADVGPFGAIGMIGNVSEWTSGAFCPLDRPDCESSLAVHRGGNWYNRYAVEQGVDRREELMATSSDHYLGFRCAR